MQLLKEEEFDLFYIYCQFCVMIANVSLNGLVNVLIGRILSALMLAPHVSVKQPIMTSMFFVILSENNKLLMTSPEGNS